MSRIPLKQFLTCMDFGRRVRLLKEDDLYKKSAYILNRFQWSKAGGDELDWKKINNEVANYPMSCDSSSESDEESSGYTNKWVSPIGSDSEYKRLLAPRTPGEIISYLQRSYLGLKAWKLSDLTIGLYLIYLKQASSKAEEDVKGELISSESIVQDLIYNVELAKGAYRNDAAGVARNSMLREKNVVKFMKESSVLKPGYYIGTDVRNKLVIFCIRGTHSIFDLITDLIITGHEEITPKGYHTHFGTTQAARWFLFHEIGTIRNCLKQHEGFRLRLVGHSLGGATAALLAIMLRELSSEQLGFSPDIVTAVTYGPPPCADKELAESCSDYVTTVVMQDDIIPRLNASSLTRLRKEIDQTDWEDVLDTKAVANMYSNAKQVVALAQDVGRKLADYANFRGTKKQPDKEETPGSPGKSSDQPEPEKPTSNGTEDLFVPGTVYYLKRNADTESKGRRTEYFTLLRRHPGDHFQRILLSDNVISDHGCENHYYALRDVLKGLPSS